MAQRPGVLKRILSSSIGRSSNKSNSEPTLLELELAKNPDMGTLTGAAKLAAVTEKMDKLAKDCENATLLPHQRDAILEEIKLYGRDPQDANPIFTQKGIATLAQHAFLTPSPSTSRIAVRTLCNCLLLREETRQMLVDLGYGKQMCKKLDSDNLEDEFLLSRLIFLMTYAKLDVLEMIDKHGLASAIINNLGRHPNRRVRGEVPDDPMVDMALTETVKLIFNVSHYARERASLFVPAIPHIIELLCRHKFKGTRPLDSPVGYLVNDLINLDIGAQDVHPSMYPPDDPHMTANRLIDILQKSTSGVYNNDELEASVTPLLGAIRGIHEYAPTAVKTGMRSRLLPTESDRQQVLGRSDTLPSWLLKNSTNPVTPQLRDAISNLLFDLSDQNASTFVENVGYGFASGFLFNRNLDIPRNAQEAFAKAGDPTRPVNPITGQYLDAEKEPEVPKMTEEEEEREAERLFVLFERLRANGIISAENPVRTAQQEGRFEELPDDHEE